MEKAKKGGTDPVTGSHFSWDRGFHWESKKKNLTLKIGGKFAVDTGNIEADDELATAFPDLEGYNTDIRFASVTATTGIPMMYVNDLPVPLVIPMCACP